MNTKHVILFCPLILFASVITAQVTIGSAGKAGHFNGDASFWSSSVWDTQSAYYRYFQDKFATVTRPIRTEADLFSVRCKLD